MNKQQLATKIWKSANKMRSKIEANEYKDYILGFIFYKFLSEKEVNFLRKFKYSDEDLKTVMEEDSANVKFIQNNIGYFIAYNNLFSTWLSKGSDFDVSNVRVALSAFNRLINPAHKKVFEGIFTTLETGLSKLGDNSSNQTKAIRDLLYLIKDIPMDGKQDYDVLGFIYEYLIGMFAANAGKKAGEFYTPHEVSLVMSEIVSHHLQSKKEIQIYDPTSGSGSLLINIGRSVAKHMDDTNKIKYYAQELKKNTYNLTRMNLVMRGISADNIVARNGDTLEKDWPYFDENDPTNTYDPLRVDAVVSNPPYSQSWDPANQENNPRFAAYGLAPKGKADYAFLLHDLYHIKPDGIMTIILPHGVLFRGGDEGKIRKNLIEKNKIDAIIGLPPNIFFGTSISTIIMVLRQSRPNTDVLIVDASKGFIKVGKKNKLRAADIKKLVDIVINRQVSPKYSRVVSLDEIRHNDYNLNISRYVDSSDEAETWDIYASMFGGIPANEIDSFVKYWNAFPTLKNSLFAKKEDGYYQVLPNDIKSAIATNPDIQKFKDNFAHSFDTFKNSLKKKLMENMAQVAIPKTENTLSDDIFNRLKNIPLLDKYDAYQLLDDEWVKIAIDLEIIQTEGFSAAKKVDENIITRKKNGKEQEVQDGWIGHVLPFELVQKCILPEQTQAIERKENRLAEIMQEYEQLIDLLPEEDKQKLLNDEDNAFVKDNVANALKEVFKDVSTTETKILEEYKLLATKDEKLAFMVAHPSIKWDDIEKVKNGTCQSKALEQYISFLKANIAFEKDSYEDILVRADKLLKEESGLKIKKAKDQLHAKTKETIETLTDKQVLQLLEKKWIDPLVAGLNALPDNIINNLSIQIKALAEKYAVTFSEVEQDIRKTEQDLSVMLDELTGEESDLKGLAELKKMLQGK